MKIQTDKLKRRGLPVIRIAVRYGRRTADFVAMQLEYPRPRIAMKRR